MSFDHNRVTMCRKCATCYEHAGPCPACGGTDTMRISKANACFFHIAGLLNERVDVINNARLAAAVKAGRRA